MTRRTRTIWLLTTLLTTADLSPPLLAQAPASRPTITNVKKKLSPKQKVKARGLATAIIWAAVIFVVLLAVLIALHRFTRRFRNYVLSGERKPTESADVWAMHKLPPDATPDDEGFEFRETPPPNE